MITDIGTSTNLSSTIPEDRSAKYNKTLMRYSITGFLADVLIDTLKVTIRKDWITV